MKKEITENGIVYTLCKDGVYYPNLIFPQEKKFEIGKFGGRNCCEGVGI